MEAQLVVLTNRKVFFSVGWSSFERILVLASGSVVFIVSGRVLRPDEYGLFAMAMVVMTFLDVFQDQGMADAIVQISDLQRGHLVAAFWYSILAGILIVGIFSGVGLILENTLGYQGLGLFAMIAGAGYPFRAIGSVSQALANRNLEFKAIAIRNISGSLVASAVAIFLLFQGVGVSALAIQIFLSSVIGGLVIFSLHPINPMAKASFDQWKELHLFGRNIVGFNILGTFSRKMDDFIIGAFLGVDLLGIYSMAYRLLMILQQTLGTFSRSIAFPVFSRLNRERPEMARMYLRSTKIMAGFAFPIFALVACTSHETITLLLGEKWGNAAPILTALAPVGALQSISPLNGAILLALGKSRERMNLMAVGVAINVVGFLVTVHWGIIAVATGYSLLTWLIYPRWIIAIKREIGVTGLQYLLALGMPLMVTFVVAMSSLLLKVFFHGWILLAASVSMILAWSLVWGVREWRR